MISISATAQLDLFPLHQDYIEESRSAYGSLDSVYHTATLPFSVKNSALEDNYFFKDSLSYYSIVKAKLLKEDLIKVTEEDFRLRVNPLFDFSGALELSDTAEYADTTTFFQNSRGFSVDGKIGKRFFFHTGFLENQAYLPGWQKAYADTSLVIPAMGRHKKFRDNGFDYAQAYGWISYYPTEKLNVFFGHGQLFSGHGYRSHLVSHQSFNFPHLKLQADLFKNMLRAYWGIGKIQTLSRKPLGEVPESLFKPKYTTFSSLDWLIGKHVELSVFHMDTWKRFSDTRGTLPLPAQTYVPVPLMNYFIAPQDSTQQSRLGGSLLLKLTNKLQVYGQYEIERSGIQVGVRTHELIPGLILSAEYNQAEEAFISDELVSFVHLNESTAHPLLGEFTELIGSVSYRKKRWLFRGLYSQNETTRKVQNISLQVSYLINPRWNFQVFSEYIYRKESNQPVNYESSVVRIGLRTPMFDSFYNF